MYISAGQGELQTADVFYPKISVSYVAKLQIVYILFIIFFFFQVIVGVQADETTIEPFFETVGNAGEKTFN